MTETGSADFGKPRPREKENVGACVFAPWTLDDDLTEKMHQMQAGEK
jgi:hypothetical protein